MCGGASFSPDRAIRKVDGMIWSPEGVCRPFADGANGTVNADGAVLAVLTTLEAAQTRGQQVYAAVLGGATNNDGSRKAGFSAPSFEGQVEVIRAAQSDAGIIGSVVDYVEGHGTGTKLGDPLEAQALTEALKTKSKVLLGSVKGNVGHMNTVAGMSGLVKATLALHHQRMVPSLHARRPSPFIDWGKTPLLLAEEGAPWKGDVAAVSSFGIGGTNAHMVLKASVSRASEGAVLQPRPRARAFKHDALVPEQKLDAIKARAQHVAASGSTSTPAAPTPSKAQAAADHADPIASFFYETCYERTDVSCLQLTEAAVILDGDSAPADLPLHSVITSPGRALTAARACGGRLLFVGTSDESPSRDDTSQEELVMRVLTLLTSLTRASRAGLEVFFVLKKNLRYAGLWGLLRVAAHEHPELRLRRLLREEGAPLALPVLPAEFLLRADGVYAPRLRPVLPPAPAPAPTTYRRALVTGGLRGLGAKVAEWLLKTARAESLVLVGRREPPRVEALEALRELAPVEVRRCDISEWGQVQELPGDCDLVVHCAGNVKDGLLLHLTREDAQRVLRPKVRGTLHLKERYPGARLLAFSSSSGLFGPAGQSTYAAANTFVDAMVPSVQWGGWAEVGMAEDLGMTALPGERFFPPPVGLQCLGRLLDGPADAGPFCVLDADWEAYRQNSGVFVPEDPLLADIGAPVGAEQQCLGSPLSLADDHTRCWEVVVGPPGSRWRHGCCALWEFCQQHVVDGQPIFPGTAFVAMAFQAAREALGATAVTLHNVALLRTLDIAAPRLLSTTLVRTASGGSLRFTSRPVQKDGPSTLHCSCTFSGAQAGGAEPLAEADLPLVDGLYEQFAAGGFNYGPLFRVVGAASDGVQQARCELLTFPDEPFTLHPAKLDAAMHLASLLHPLGVRGVPQSIRRIALHGGATPTKAAASFVRDQLDFQVLGSAGEVVCHVEGLALATLDAPPSLLLRRRVWTPIAPEPRGAWLAVGQEALQLGLPQTTECSEEPHTATLLAFRANRLEDVHECRLRARQVAAQEPCVVLALEAPYAEAAAFAAAEVGAQAVIGTEHNVRTASGGLGMSQQVVRVRDGQLFAASLEQAEEGQPRVASKHEPFAVTLDASRAARGARCRLSKRRAPAPHEVELQTSIWALNFRDVLVAMGALSTEVAGQALGIGGETFGEVVAVGSAVSNLSVGDRVIAVPPDGMGSYVTTDARWVTQLPGSMTPEEAVSGTCAYGTAWLGLHWMARISKADRVLIHSAAGGVGLAAVHLCLRKGCTVYATASTAKKQALLLSLGVTAVFDSRDVSAFDQGVRRATQGEGVDVVLNSLSGEAISTSLRLLRPFGRFIELGKRDQYEDTQLGLGPFIGGLTYAAAHFDVLMLQYPDQCRRLLEEVWGEMPSLPRLPMTSFSIAELPQALEYFSKGVHVGKVLVTVEETPVLPALPSAVSGPAKDVVAAALQAAISARWGKGGVVCIPQLEALTSLEELNSAEAVVTASMAVASLVRSARPEVLCVQLPRWEPVRGIEDMLQLGGQLVAVEEEEQGGALKDWLMEAVSDMVGSIGMDTTFESAGFDSLMLISLARRLSTKVGKAVSVTDLYDHPTPQLLLESFTGRPLPEMSRAKAVCLHGFRSNKDAMALQLAPFISAVGFVDWVFVNASRSASGPADPKIPVTEAFEWWGQPDGPFETGWMAPHFEGLGDTLPSIVSLKPAGVVGFSQGAAVAALVQCAWVALFSAVAPPGLQHRPVPSFHCFDPAEDFASQCVDVSSYFPNKSIFSHNRGHMIPQDAELIRRFTEFVSAQMAAASEGRRR
uniref:Type I polyketide synthase n=1 Tax=Gambierdiscus polynesiensis TaxID=439318 RepID=A0A1S6K871_9DINO|nr:type I polyketide synthase [Gambierdiscus polynesiensis]